jgi:hypothetical protein
VINRDFTLSERPARLTRPEEAMHKTLSAIVIATIAFVTFTTSAAEAGLLRRLAVGAVIGAAIHHSLHHRERVYVVERVYVARPQVVYTRPEPVYVQQDEAPAPALVHNENSTIAVDSADVADNATTDSAEKIIVKKDQAAVAAPKPAKVAEAAVEVAKPQPSKRIDCKKFFPSVGMTLTVPCE